ncbi:MAG: carboxyltransferase [Thermoleophilia bacterium]|nr:carboxyltransferase [Thermoleophilia bacterium]
MARIEIIDQSLRDGQQSYWGMRMRAGQMLPVADAIDSAGYRIVDLTGSSIFEVMVRFREENPWKGLDAIRASLPSSTLRAGTRTNGIVGMNVTPDSIVELWIRSLAKHGIESLWIFDCLHDAENMIRVAKIARDAGMAPSPQLNFSESPVHTDDYYADVISRMIAGNAAETIILGDEAGVLGPERARQWIRLAQQRASAGETALEMHFHNRTAMANLNHIIGVEEGVRIAHSAISTLANGVSMPSTEVTVDNLRRLGHEVAVDDSRFAEVAEHFGGLADDEGFARGAPVEYSVAAIQQQFPGGMMGTLREQLKQVGMQERLPAVLEEAIQVRSEMGWPIMATPFSQLVGIQALLNVVQGERYATIPDENMMYLAGWYGTPPGEVDAELLDRVAASERGREILAAGGAPQPSLKEIRAEYGENLSDEELLLRYLIPGDDVDKMYAANNPIEPIYPIGGEAGLGWLRDLIANAGTRGVRASRGPVSVTLRR